ncbi:MAG: GntR family transcriptional regulator, partial [Syntrophomonadaceae bacterium]|nr:GntR family transcriptional regulator [Syntrophomonadaceae bacterium]
MEDGSPLYLQIIRHIKQGIVAETIQNQDEMPSRRVLSSLLGVNPNTVQ